MKISSGALKHVENELEAYAQTKREIERLKADILHGRNSPDENIGGGKSNLPSDPTGTTGTILASHESLQHMQKVVTTIERVYGSADESKRKLIRLRYWTRPQTLTWDGIAIELNCHRATALRWRDEIVIVIAASMGWR
jgi:RinA family phage transcriptional activator